jgi:hypothetical protein
VVDQDEKHSQSEVLRELGGIYIVAVAVGWSIMRWLAPRRGRVFRTVATRSASLVRAFHMKGYPQPVPHELVNRFR